MNAQVGGFLDDLQAFYQHFLQYCSDAQGVEQGFFGLESNFVSEACALVSR